MRVLFVAADDTLVAPCAARIAARILPAGDEAGSAGLVAGELDWLVGELLDELGLSLRGHLPRRLSADSLTGLDLVVTLDEAALDGLPELPPGIDHGHLAIVAPVPPDVHALALMRADLEREIGAALGRGKAAQAD